MKKGTKETITAIGITGIIAIGILAIFGIPYIMGLDDERITVEGKIIDVNIEQEKMWANRYDIIELVFETGHSYKIKKYIGFTDGSITDFTVNSKFIIEFFRPDPDSYWEIEHIYKVPDGD